MDFLDFLRLDGLSFSLLLSSAVPDFPGLTLPFTLSSTADSSGFGMSATARDSVCRCLFPNRIASDLDEIEPA